MKSLVWVHSQIFSLVKNIKYIISALSLSTNIVKPDVILHVSDAALSK